MTACNPWPARAQVNHGAPNLAQLGLNQPIENIDGGNWSPSNPGSTLTPACPGSISGLSTFLAAGAAPPRAMIGSDNLGLTPTQPANFGRAEPGIPEVLPALKYPLFSDTLTRDDGRKPHCRQRGVCWTTVSGEMREHR